MGSVARLLAQQVYFACKFILQPPSKKLLKIYSCDEQNLADKLSTNRNHDPKEIPKSYHSSDYFLYRLR